MTRYRHLITDDNRKWWTLGAMCFALFMVMLDNTVVNVALPSIQRDLHAQISALEWVINNTFPATERGRAIGIWAGVSALALSIGPVVGGALTEYVSWRAIFFINLPVAVGAVVTTIFAVTESRDETVDRRVDYPGVVVL